MAGGATTKLLTEILNVNVSQGIECNFQDSNAKAVRVQRKLGLGSAIVLTLSSIIGAGIFISPKGVLKYSGSVGMSLLIWGISGLISMIGAICYVELGTSIPISGGNFTYLLVCLGELPAFLYLWACIVIFVPVFNVILSLTFANYILQLFFPNCAIPTGAVRLVGFLPVCVLAYVNCRKVHWAIRVQGIFTAAKFMAVATIIIAGAFHLYSCGTQNFSNAFQGTTTNPGFMVLGFYHGIYAFEGWNCINFITEEVKRPTVTLPRNIYISLSVVTVVYIMTNVAYMAVLTPNEILASNAVAVTFGAKIFGPILSSVMSLFVVLSTFGTLNCRIYRYSRLFYAAAREGHLPNLLAMVHIKYLTPVPSIIFMFLLTTTYLSTTEVLFLINYGRFVSSVFTMLTIAGFLCLRYKDPNLERPVKVSIFFPITFLLVSAFFVIFPFFADFWQPLMGLAVVSTGVPIYMGAVIWKNKPIWYNKVLRKFTSFTQKLLLSVPEEKDK